MLQLTPVSTIRLRTSWLVLGALALAGLLLFAGVRRTLPQTSGAVHVSGLHSPVTIARDRWGVPYIFAADEHDLSLAQGYVTAQDRLWQMLLRRQAAQGRLGDWLGADAAAADQVLRRQDFPSQATTALSALEEPARATLEAYAVGVNACMATCPTPLELSFQHKTNVVPWTATDSLALSQMMRWAQLPDTELRTTLLSRLGPDRVSALWPERVSLAGSMQPANPAVRQALQLIGAPLTAGGVEAAPVLPSPWYVMSLRADRVTASGATWPGVPSDARLISNTADQPADPSPALVKHLLALPPEGWLQFRVHGMLRQWDYDLSGATRLGNASAAVYEVWVWHLARDTFQDEMGAELFARYWAAGLAPDALVRLSDRPGDAWWDDVTTGQPETRDDIMRRAYAAALLDLGRHYGDLHTIWEWDTMHAAVLRHPLGRAWPLAWLNREVKLGGDAPFNPAQPADPLRPYAATIVTFLRIRQDVDGKTWFAMAGGQSGHPLSPHYTDLLSLLAQDKHVLLQDPARPEDLANAEGVLVLTP